MSSHAITKPHEAQIKREIAHLTRPLWRAAIIAVCMIVAWGAVWRIVHVTAVQRMEMKHAIDAR